MPLNNDVLEASAIAMLKALKKESPKSIGNLTLMKKLNLKSEDYFEVRNYLFEKGQVQKAMGKGGATVYVDQQADGSPLEPAEVKKGELSLYAPIRDTLEGYWVGDMGYSDDYIIEIIGCQGKKTLVENGLGLTLLW